MTRICRITVAHTVGLLAARLLAVRRRLWWLGVPAAAVMVSAGLLATAPAASADLGGVQGVNIAQVGNDLLMAGAGPNQSLVVYYQTIGSSTWSQVTAAPAPYSYTLGPHGGVAITALTEWVGLRRITLIGMAAEGPDYSLDFWWQPLADIGSGPWHQEVLAGPYTTYSTPSIAQIGNTVAVAAQGEHLDNGGLDFYWQQIGATGWHSFLGQAPGLVQDGPTMAVLASPSDMLGIAFTDDQGNVRYVQQTPSSFGSWQGPYTVGNTGLSGVDGLPSPPSIAALDNNLTAITALGANASLYQWMTPEPPSFVNTTKGAFPGTAYYGISTAQLGNGVVAATTQGENGTLYFYWRLPDSAWHLENLGGPGGPNEVPPQVIALTNSAGTQLAATAMETPDYGADLYWQRIGSSTWNLATLPPGSFGS